MSEQSPNQPNNNPSQHPHYEGYVAGDLDSVLNPVGPTGGHDNMNLSGPDRRSLNAGFDEVAQSYDQPARTVSGADFERVHQLSKGGDQEITAHANELATWSPQDQAAFTTYHMARLTESKNTQAGAHDRIPTITSAQRSAEVDQLEAQFRESGTPEHSRPSFPPLPSNQELVKRKSPSIVRRTLGRLGIGRPRKWPY